MLDLLAAHPLPVAEPAAAAVEGALQPATEEAVAEDGGVQMPNGRTFSYAYDYRTQRIGITEAPSTLTPEGRQTRVLFSGGLSFAEWEVSGSTPPTTAAAPSVEYTRGPDMGGGVGGLLYTRRSTTLKYDVSNGRGDIVLQTGQNKSVTWTASYEAFGKRTKETGTNADKQRANSKDEDPTGLLNEGFRYRDLESGVWLSRDPAGFVDGPNLYAYVKQNPWSAWDPHGLNLVTQLAKKGLKVITHDADGVAKIAGKRATDYMPRGVLPGGTFQLPGDLAKKYPQGVKFDKEGFPDFSSFRKGPDVKIEMTGDSGKDLLAADKKAGVTEAWRKENGLTWHHHQDGETMQLIPSEVNGNTPHIGGAAITRSAKKIAADAGYMAAELIAPNTTALYATGGAGVLGYGKAVAKDVAENLDPGIGLVANKENAAWVGKNAQEALMPGSSEGVDYTHSWRPPMWESFKGTVKGAWDYVTGK